MKILFVDDEANICELFDEYFKEDFHITFAANGETALKLATTEHFDLIISDISLPKMNGFQFLQSLHTAGITIPFIVITGDTDIQLAIDIFRLGAVDFFLKPFRMEALRLRILRFENAEFDTGAIFDSGEASYQSFEITIKFHSQLRNINRYVAVILDHIQSNPKIKEDDLLSLRVVIYELLINAIEHGSAGISYTEKQSLLESTENYCKYIDNICTNQNSMIYLYLKLDHQGIVFKIRDEGKGFEIKKVPSPIFNSTANLLHGRGIFLVRMNVDSLDYNEMGNEVTVTKHWSKID